MTEKRLTPIARRLRHQLTDAEKLLWRHLRARQIDGCKFVRQFPIGPYVVDFSCRSARLVIELDGGQHAVTDQDAERTKLIDAHGFTVIRFWNHEVLANIDGVLQDIQANLLLARNR